MRRDLALAIGLMMASSALGFAQEDSSAERPEPPRRHLQVLQDPHDISSFYQSSPASAYTESYGLGVSGASQPISGHHIQVLQDPYDISSFYQSSGSPWGFSAGRRRTLSSLRFRRIGPSELCLVAPTVLHPFTPFVFVATRPGN